MRILAGVVVLVGEPFPRGRGGVGARGKGRLVGMKSRARWLLVFRGKAAKSRLTYIWVDSVYLAILDRNCICCYIW